MLFLMFSPFYGLILTANLTSAARVWRYVALTVSAILSGLLCVVGGLLALSPLINISFTSMPGADPVTAGVLAFVTGVVSLLLLVTPLRQWLIKTLRLNLDADNALHIIAMILAVWFLGGNLANISLSRNVSLETLTQAYPTQNLSDIWEQGIALAFFAVLGVGLGLRRSWRETLERLGLRRLTLPQLVLIPAAIIGLLMIGLAVSLLWSWLDPVSATRIDELSNALLQNAISPIGALSVGFAAGIGEELLFRGAVQPRFGLLITSLLFTVAHNQYEFSLATVNVFAIALLLGLVRRYANTTACILIHAGYNTTLMLFALVSMSAS